MLSALFSLCACSGDKEVAGGQQEKGLSETMERVRAIGMRDCVLEMPYPASIRGRQDIAILPQVSGRLTALRVAEGQRVRKGEVLFVIDQVPFLSACATAKAHVEVARANVATAELVYASKQQLLADSVVSAYDCQTAEHAYLSAKAQLAQAEAEQVLAENNLSYTEVKSPCDGVVGTLPFREGALVSPEMNVPLTTVSDNSSVYVYFSITETEWLQLVREHGSKERALELMPSVRLQLSDRSLYEEEGRVEAVSGVIDAATGTVSARSVFPNSRGLLTSGGTGNIILRRSCPQALVIPRTATFEVQDKVFVYRAVNGHAVATQVAVTRLNGGAEYIVGQGLQAGDSIVVSGVAMLKEGEEI